MPKLEIKTAKDADIKVLKVMLKSPVVQIIGWEDGHPFYLFVSGKNIKITK